MRVLSNHLQESYIRTLQGSHEVYLCAPEEAGDPGEPNNAAFTAYIKALREQHYKQLRLRCIEFTPKECAWSQQ